MKKILVIQCYLGKDVSLSEYATEKFIDEYKKIKPEDQITYLDLNKEKKLQYILTANNFNDFWNEDSERYLNLVKEADKIIIQTGMVNFSITPILKNFFDNILVANKTFRYKYDGISEGLLNPNTKIQLILAQGSKVNQYKFSAFDNYLEDVLKFIGFVDINKIIFDGTKTAAQANLSIDEKFNLKKNEFNENLKKFVK